MAIVVTSPAFTQGSPIPSKYTCDGQDISPPLRWSGVPRDSRSLALVADDPDAPRGTWVHWVMYSIPPSVAELPEGVPTVDTTPQGARQGVNDSRKVGYSGPCPPRGGPHRYFFKLYALDMEIDLSPGATKQDLLRAMEGHVIAEGQLMGTYQRQ